LVIKENDKKGSKKITRKTDKGVVGSPVLLPLEKGGKNVYLEIFKRPY